MTIGTRQHDDLLRAPSAKAVFTRSQGGKTFTYLAQHAVRTELIRVFGFDGWEGKVVDADLLLHKTVADGKWVAAWRVRYQLTVRWQADDEGRYSFATSTWCEDAVGQAHGSSPTDVLDQALKSAASDAMKRCAMNLGSRFGIGLYFDGYRGEVVRSTPQTTGVPPTSGGAETDGTPEVGTTGDEVSSPPGASDALAEDETDKAAKIREMQAKIDALQSGDGEGLF